MSSLPLSIAFGLIFGSFLSLLIPRLHQGEKGIVAGRSHCPECKHLLRAIDLLPLLSYLFQKGRCRYCKKKISFWYPITELALLSFSIGLALLYPEPKFYALHFPLLFVAVFIFLYDLRYKEIHEAILLPGILYAVFYGLTQYGWESTGLGLAIGGLFFGLQFVLSRGRWLGSGDIEIGLFMGALLGFPHILVGIFSSYLLGSFLSLILLATKKASGQTALPLGPFLMLGTVLSFVWGEKLLSLYFSAL
ncbi:prepilin peptidase [Candidatus Peregrinibacteria bacterium]|nr:MAG: prepilin peptidase [Candidatus Peregrinibacteria bacterium]